MFSHMTESFHTRRQECSRAVSRYRRVSRFGLAIMIGVAVYCVFGLSWSYAQDRDSRRLWYAFETGKEGWKHQASEDSQGCTQVAQSDERARDGNYSLKLAMNLVTGDKNKSKGEAWTDMRDRPPRVSGEPIKIPVDLKGRTITAWVYAPKGAAGDADRPNGFQLFVKDNLWKALYGDWRNVIEGEWNQISVTVEASKPPLGYLQEGFDPTKIIAIGVKMGTGDGSSHRGFRGPVYFDTVRW